MLRLWYRPELGEIAKWRPTPRGLVDRCRGDLFLPLIFAFAEFQRPYPPDCGRVERLVRVEAV
jgi:hypothetical protein